MLSRSNGAFMGQGVKAHVRSYGFRDSCVIDGLGIGSTCERLVFRLPRVKQSIVTLDLEGVLIPEIWIAFAEKTGIEELRLTTRDIPDYDELMRGRLKILAERGSDAVGHPGGDRTRSRRLDGAKANSWTSCARSTQCVILSDTFLQFAKPLMRQLGWPTLFCNSLEVEPTIGS